MSKYTPGPWVATARRVRAPETEGRLALDVQLNGGNRDDNKANARLIAAAPDLLVALQDCILVMERELNGLAVIQPELREARAAYFKATGRTA